MLTNICDNMQFYQATMSKTLTTSSVYFIDKRTNDVNSAVADIFTKWLFRLKKLTTQILFHDQNWHVFSRDDDFFEKN